MIAYDRTRWWRTAIAFHGTVLPHTLGRVGLFTLFCLAIWSFCRAYYFAFYVIEHYVDPAFRFAGLLDFAKYLLRRK